MLAAGDTSTKIAARGIAPFRILINSYTKPFEEKVAAGASRKDIVGEIIHRWSGDQDGFHLRPGRRLAPGGADGEG
jgi:hypothetical protein